MIESDFRNFSIFLVENVAAVLDSVCPGEVDRAAEAVCGNVSGKLPHISWKNHRTFGKTHNYKAAFLYGMIVLL